MGPHVQRLAIHTSDGLSLRAEQSHPDHPIAAAVLCHPHPLHGGNMFASVIDTLFTALSEAGVMCLRFNFRGVGGSDGRHDHGHGEQLDALAAVEHMVEESPDTAIWAVGWSFGADVALGITHPRLAGWVAVAPPLKVIAPSDMGAATDERPVLLLVPEHDQFNPPERAAETTAGWTATRMVTIAMADHFLNGRLDAVADAAIERIAGLAD